MGSEMCIRDRRCEPVKFQCMDCVTMVFVGDTNEAQAARSESFERLVCARVGLRACAGCLAIVVIKTGKELFEAHAMFDPRILRNHLIAQGVDERAAPMTNVCRDPVFRPPFQPV